MYPNSSVQVSAPIDRRAFDEHVRSSGTVRPLALFQGQKLHHRIQSRVRIEMRASSCTTSAANWECPREPSARDAVPPDRCLRGRSRRRGRPADHRGAGTLLGRGCHRHPGRARLPGRGGDRGPDRSSRPIGMAVTRRTATAPARGRDRGRPSHLQHGQQVGRGDLRQSRAGHLVRRGAGHGRSGGRAAVPELRPGRPSRVPAEYERLREMGVLVGSYEPHPPKASGGADRYRWEEALEPLAPRVSERS